MKKKKTKTWQYMTPQQESFLRYYLDPKSETWSDAKNSALKANYENEYAENIMNLMPQWLSEALSDTRLLDRALKNLSDFMDDNENKSIKWDANKFVLSTVGKNKFSTRQEVTGKDGKDLIPDEIVRAKSKDLIKNYLDGGNTK